MRFDRPIEAVRYAPQGSGVLLLADGYPDSLSVVSPEIYDQAKTRGLRVYVEYPGSFPGMFIAEPKSAEGERGVVARNWFEPALKPMRILTLHQCSFVPIDAVNADLLLTKVAGFDTAVFGLPPWKSPYSAGGTAYPLLVKSPLAEVYVASSKLSNFITGRYAPAAAWTAIWERILAWLVGEKVVLPEWSVSVGPAYARDDILPSNAESQALRQGAQWYFNARLFIHPSWEEKANEIAGLKNPVGPAPEPKWEAGDGKLGMLEGIASRIDAHGNQPARYCLRNDCMGEASMALAFDFAVHGTALSRDVSANLNDFIYTISGLAKGPRSDPKSPSFGLVGWSLGPGEGIYYGDDNARSMLGTIAAGALLKTDRWDESVLRCLLANLRTTGLSGFRPNSVNEGTLQKAGWQHYFNLASVEPSPHYQAYLWATFLWGYKQTGYAPFLERAKTGIAKTMELYPAQWRWTNGLQQERARMLLPLSWLVRIEDTPEHREWLHRVAADLLALQDSSGAIQEQFGAPELGTIPPLKSNEDYGKSETPIIQQNADPGSDLLYTCNFAFLGLHEAAAATKDAFYTTAEQKLADFLCRIQIRSVDRPELDGGWYRAFDFKRWEYWGSSGDVGWGAWSIESGWTQGWICSVFALRQMKTSFWELTASSQIKRHIEGLVATMMAGASEPPGEAKITASCEGEPGSITLSRGSIPPS
jgi:hypothetical protein